MFLRGSNLPTGPKIVYENDRAQTFWDVPVYSDHEEVKANRIGAQIVDNSARTVILLEISCALPDNRKSKNCGKMES